MKSSSKVAILLRSWQLVARSAPGLLTWSLLLQFLQAVVPFGVFYLIKLIVDKLVEGLSNNSIETGTMIGYVSILGGLWLSSGVLNVFAQRVESLLQLRFTDYISGIIQAQSIKMDLSYYENPELKDTFHRAQREAMYRPYQMVHSLMQLVQSGIFLVLVLGFLITLNPWLILLLIISGIPGLIIKMRLAKKQYALEKKITQADRRSYYLHNLLTRERGAKEVRLYRYGQQLMEQYKAIRTKMYTDRKGLFNLKAGYDVIGSATEVLALTIGVGWTALQSLKGLIPVGSLVMYLQAFQRGQGQYRAAMNALAQLYTHRLFLSYLFDFLDLEQHISDPDPADIQPLRSASVFRVKNVSFRYPGREEWAVKNVNLELHPGERVALAGLNGSGKTTLVKLLGRLYDPPEGRLLIGDKDYRELPLEQLRQQVSVAFQQPLRYPFSAAENIRIGDLNREYSLDNIKAAAQFAGADEFIESLPQGFETVLGYEFYGGTELSGGQWQQVALARAIYKEASLLILDEPMSQMDPLKEQAFMDRLYGRKDQQAVLFVTHRLHHLQQADRIVVMDGGRIVEEGSFNELMGMKGLFARMFNS